MSNIVDIIFSVLVLIWIFGGLFAHIKIADIEKKERQERINEARRKQQKRMKGMYSKKETIDELHHDIWGE